VEFHTTVTDFDVEHMTTAATPCEIFVCRGHHHIHVRPEFRKQSFHRLVVEARNRYDLVGLHRGRPDLCDDVGAPHVDERASANGVDDGIGIFVCSVGTERHIVTPIAIAKSPSDDPARIAPLSQT
jgi:hypothetical protein